MTSPVSPRPKSKDAMFERWYQLDHQLDDLRQQLSRQAEELAQLFGFKYPRALSTYKLTDLLDLVRDHPDNRENVLDCIKRSLETSMEFELRYARMHLIVPANYRTAVDEDVAEKRLPDFSALVAANPTRSVSNLEGIRRWLQKTEMRKKDLNS